MHIGSYMKDWFIKCTLYSSFKKTEGEGYIVAPAAPFGKAFFLNEAQFQIFQKWYFNNVGSIKRPAHVWVIAGLSLLAIFELLYAQYMDYIGLGLFMLLVVIVNSPTFWISYKAWRKKMNHEMESFPFLEAPSAQFSFETWFKRFWMVSSSIKFLDWIVWVLLLIEGAKFVLVSFAALLMFFMELLEPEQLIGIEEVGTMIAAIVAQGVVILILLAFVIPQRRFKKRTGKPCTIENLYINELGHEPNFPQA